MMKVVTTIAAIALAVAAAPVLAQDVAVQVKEEKAGLLAQATVKPDSAQKIALAQVPGGKIAEVEIEEENGRLVYDIDVTGTDGTREIYIDAKTGEVVTFDTEEPAAMGAGISEGEPGLLAQATIQPDSAERIALQAVPGGSVAKRQIERKDGKLVYSFEIKVAGQEAAQSVQVDALTGAIVKAEEK